MKLGLALLLSVAACAPALAFDPSPLPQSCQDTLAGMQTDKAQFASLGKVMTQARKASDTESFCKAARETVVIIKGQSSRLDDCVGELADDKTIAQSAADQMFGLRTVYKQMLEAAKKPENDRFHCGLAEQ